MVKYGIVGVFNVALDFILYAVLVREGVWYVLAKAISLVIATLNGYSWNRVWTFQAGSHEHVGLAKYVLVQAGCFTVNIGLLLLLVELADKDKFTAQMITIPLVATVSFLANRHWTFRQPVPGGR